jgi:hypothetical protein
MTDAGLTRAYPLSLRSRAWAFFGWPVIFVEIACRHARTGVDPQVWSLAPMIRRSFRNRTTVAALLWAISSLAQAQAQAPADLPPASPPAAAATDDASTPTPPAPVVAAPVEVQAQSLSQLDLFSSGRETGLGTDVWKGASADLARSMIPTLAERPLSPAGEGLARRLLAQTATAPDGAGSDMPLALARARAVLALGDAAGAATILTHTPGVPDSSELSQLAAEAALIGDQEDQACDIAANLTLDRQGAYWLRLRAFCQARAGRSAEAQLTYTLAVQQARDPVYARLMGAVLAGGGDPGPASLRNGLDYALSKQLRLDLGPALAAAPPAIVRHLEQAAAPAVAPTTGSAAPAEADIVASLRGAADPGAYAAAAHAAAPAIAALAQAKAPLANPIVLATAAVAAGDLATAQAIRAGLVQDTAPGAGPTGLAILDAAIAAASGRTDSANLDRLIERGAGEPDPASRARAQAAAAFFAGLGGGMSGQASVAFAGFDLPRSDIPPARLMALNLAAASGLKGQTALFVLQIAQAGGAAGPGPADRAWIVQALAVAGLKADAQAFAVEGLCALQGR